MNNIEFINYLLIGAFCTLFIVQLGAYFLGYKNKAQIFIALASLSAGIYLWTSNEIHFSETVQDWIWLSRVQLLFYLVEIALLLTVLYMLNNKLYKYLYVFIMGVLISACLANLHLPYGLVYGDNINISYQQFDGWNYRVLRGEVSMAFMIISTTYYLSFLAYVLLNIYAAIKKRASGKTLFLVAFLALFVSSNVYDVFVDYGLATVYITEYAMVPLIFITSLDLILAQRKKFALENTLIKTRENFSSVIHDVDLLVVGINTEGNIVYANPSFLKTTSQSWENTAQQSIDNYIQQPKEKEQLIPLRIKKGENGKDIQNTIKSKDGKYFNIIWTCLPVQDFKGFDNVIICLGKDITLNIANQQKLELAYAELNKTKKLLEEENTYLKVSALKDNNSIILGSSDAIEYVKHSIEDVAQTDSSVLIEGETGVGKELVAESIYRKSKRADRPFVKVDCGALSKDLIESELFGHEKGAFTGAVAPRKGKFELADKGTLFLDEIGEFPLELQPKLLRVLQSGEIMKLGSEKTKTVDVRVISATNRKLKDEFTQGGFREDLYYRLSVFPISVPPLRNRMEDLEVLAQVFAQEFSQKFHQKELLFSVSEINKLKKYSWPGNIRELRNVIERSVILSRGGKLKIQGLLETTIKTVRPASLLDNERQFIEKTLIAHNWKIRGKESASEALNINESTLRSKMKKLGIERPTSFSND